MKFLFRSIFFHFICILIFTLLYNTFSVSFDNTNHTNRTTILDFLLLSTTIQAGVGISGFYPINATGKLIMFLLYIYLHYNVFVIFVIFFIFVVIIIYLFL